MTKNPDPNIPARPSSCDPEFRMLARYYDAAREDMGPEAALATAYAAVQNYILYEIEKRRRGGGEPMR